jgi:hypothetical protein
MEMTESGMLTDVRLDRYIQRLLGITLTLLPNVIEVRFGQLTNAGLGVIVPNDPQLSALNVTDTRPLQP